MGECVFRFGLDQTESPVNIGICQSTHRLFFEFLFSTSQPILEHRARQIIELGIV